MTVAVAVASKAFGAIHAPDGFGKLAGTVTRDGEPAENVMVCAFKHQESNSPYLFLTISLFGESISDASGAWEIERLPKHLRYLTVALDPEAEFDPAIKINLIPEDL